MHLRFLSAFFIATATTAFAGLFPQDASIADVKRD